MPKSMTGFGEGSIITNNEIISVEIKTVNHRFLDVSIQTPTNLYRLENDIKKIIQKNFERGRIECKITIENKKEDQSDLSINWSLLATHMDAVQAVQTKYNISINEALSVLTQIPEVILKNKNELAQHYVNGILETVQLSCDRVINMREEEGQLITEDMMHRLQIAKKIINQLGDRRETVIMEYRDRILDRIFSLNNSQMEDSAQIHQEVALLAEKGDITEEITRLHSHVKQFIQTVHEEQVIGKKLGFILQEMQREVNTIGSKSNDTLISHWVVVLKTEMEKIKEQIQNIE
ncbi:YicC/YloC family endoribonuclease [Paraliobacillus salinarum]|uniref:YicC/YloC family endoribonuclease n=1 Tax=Paraliobacillus salinarum TaxID=1158996 RepID=UPI0015F77ED0|nr:YicC/YloC family endoribonuclease [Paraliobacillus salinarum]